jgi:hypothetical protein
MVAGSEAAIITRSPSRPVTRRPRARPRAVRADSARWVRKNGLTASPPRERYLPPPSGRRRWCGVRRTGQRWPPRWHPPSGLGHGCPPEDETDGLGDALTALSRAGLAVAFASAAWIAWDIYGRRYRRRISAMAA